MKSSFKKQAGFNLIEVLLAFFILSIGLLGVAGLQTTAVQASHTSMLRTIAITRGESILERMRVNTAASKKDYEQVRAAANALGLDKNCNSLGNATTGTPICDPADLAKNDVYLWGLSLVNAGLPSVNTEAEILVDDTVDPNRVAVSIYWKERGEDMFFTTVMQE